MSKYVLNGMIVLLIALSMMLFAATPVLAMDVRSGDVVTVAKGEVVDDDLYVAGETVIINGTINGDLWAGGRTITVNGTVNGSILAGGETININGDVAHAVRLVGGTININANIDGDLLIGGNDVTITNTGRIDGDLLFGVENILIDGFINGDIKGGGSDVTIADGVGGDIELGVDSLTIASMADIQGNLTYTSENEATIQSGADIGGKTTHNTVEVAEVSPFEGIGGKIAGFLMTLVTGIVIIILIPRRSISITDSIRHKPWQSLGWGAIVLFATPVAALIVCITVVGVPVGLISLVVYGIAIYLSQILVGLFIGRWIIGYFREVESKPMLIGAMAAGLVILRLLRLIPYLGFLIALVAILFGLGAVVVSETRLRNEAQQVTST